jgi:hypothetical protein
LIFWRENSNGFELPPPSVLGAMAFSLTRLSFVSARHGTVSDAIIHMASDVFVVMRWVWEWWKLSTPYHSGQNGRRWTTSSCVVHYGIFRVDKSQWVSLRFFTAILTPLAEECT